MRITIARSCPAFQSHTVSATYLNNAGVLLTERRCFPEALATFEDALEVCSSMPSPAEVEHTVYRAFLRLSSVTDDEDKELLSLATSKTTSTSSKQPKPVRVPEPSNPIIYDQYGNDMSMNRSNNHNESKIDSIFGRNFVVSPFDQLRAGLLHVPYFLVYFRANHHHIGKGGDFQTKALLLATIFANQGQLHRVLARYVASAATISGSHLKLAHQRFLQAQQQVAIELRPCVPYVSFPPPLKADYSSMLYNNNNNKNSNNKNVNKVGGGLLALDDAMMLRAAVARSYGGVVSTTLQPRCKLNPAA